MISVFDDNANEYDEWFRVNSNLYDSEYEALSSMLDVDKEYVEVGVGTGLFATRLRINEGVEPCEPMATIARSRGVKVLPGVAEKLPYDDASIDGILMITVDCFVKDIMSVFNEAHRVIKEGGSYVMAFLDRETPLGAVYEANKNDDIYYKDATFRSFDEMKVYLEKAGFCIVKTKQTIFTLDNIIQPAKDGTGEGVFAIIKAVKEK